MSPEQTRAERLKTSTQQTSRYQITSGLRLHYGKLFCADDEICVFVCLTKTENEKARGTL